MLWIILQKSNMKANWLFFSGDPQLKTDIANIYDKIKVICNMQWGMRVGQKKQLNPDVTGSSSFMRRPERWIENFQKNETGKYSETLKKIWVNKRQFESLYSIQLIWRWCNSQWKFIEYL